VGLIPFAPRIWELLLIQRVHRVQARSYTVLDSVSMIPLGVGCRSIFANEFLRGEVFWFVDSGMIAGFLVEAFGCGYGDDDAAADERRARCRP
jgi:hypothetical protein